MFVTKTKYKRRLGGASILDAKKILESCKNKKTLLLKCIDYREELRLTALSPKTTNYGPTKGNGYDIHKLNAAERYLQAESALETALNNYLESQKRAREIIDKLPPSELTVLLTFRYIAGHTWGEISARLGRNVSYCHKLHKKALELLAN